MVQIYMFCDAKQTFNKYTIPRNTHDFRWIDAKAFDSVLVFHSYIISKTTLNVL